MKYLKYFVALAVIALIYWGIPKNEAALKNKKEWEAYVKQKNEDYKSGDESPIKDKKNFQGLKYFPYNEKLIVKFTVDRKREGETWVFPNSDGTKQSIEIFGSLNGEIDGQSITLLAFKEEGIGFFIPFKDKTAPIETYGGGKYIDVPEKNLENDVLIVDFNYSYFPYCAYSKGYSCPIPPQENFLPLRIEAGEKN